MAHSTHITYQELVGRYGEELAYDFLVLFEKSANIRDNIIHIGEEARLQRALSALGETSDRPSL
jgi:hypothetical protein